MPALETTIAAIMLVSLIGYAVLGGADFGAGVWDLLASGPRRDRQREAIADAIGAIWEANHVWLILVIVILFTGFPRAFSVIMTALHIPVTLMLIGIVLRGASFVFRAYDVSENRVERRWGAVFSSSSTITPVMLGIIVGGVSSGQIEVEDGMVTSGWFNAWVGVFPLAVGGFTLSLFAFLAAVFLTIDTFDEPDLREDFRRRALLAAVAVGAFALLVALLSVEEAPLVRDRLLHSSWAWPLQIVTGLAAAGAIAALLRRRFFLARTLAVTQIALILTGWGLSLNPYLVVDDVRLHDAAAPDVTLRLLLGGLSLGALVLFPSLYYLYRVFKGERAFVLVDWRGEYRALSADPADPRGPGD
jgi:cytochrome d ubiquinol oxidase subunit II